MGLGVNTKATPKVSVVVPVYNVERYLAATIESVVNQSLNSWELILVDDGSTDQSKAIAEEMARKDMRIKVLTQPNSGVSRARNNGITSARGEFIAFLDSDDKLPKHALETHLRQLEENTADVSIGGTMRFDGEKQWPLETHYMGDGEKQLSDECLLWSLGPCNKMFRRTAIGEVRFPEDLSYAEDQVFVFGVLLKARRIFTTNETVYFYRREGVAAKKSLSQQTKNNPAETLNQIFEVWLRVCKAADDSDVDRATVLTLKRNYLKRLSSSGVDLWLAIESAVLTKDETVQCEAIRVCRQFLDAVDDAVFADQEEFVVALTEGVAQLYPCLAGDACRLFVSLVEATFERLSADDAETWGMRHASFVESIHPSLVLGSDDNLMKYGRDSIRKARLRKAKSAIRKTGKAIVLAVVKSLPIKESLVVLANNKDTGLDGNLAAIKAGLDTQGAFSVEVFTGKNRRGVLNEIRRTVAFSRARFIVIDDYYRPLYGFPLKPQTEVIQVWHACGAFKKFGFSAVGQADSNSWMFEHKAHSFYSKILVSSMSIAPCYEEAFGAPREKIMSIGIPRTDALLDPEKQVERKGSVYSLFPQLKGRKVALYAPTFRGGPKDRRNFKLELDVEGLLKAAGPEWVLLLRMHPIVDKAAIRVPEELSDRVINVTGCLDTNDFLLVTDVLITDYSSVLFDAALLDVPAVSYAYDYEKYLNERGFYFPYDEFFPGPIATTNEELLRVFREKMFDMTSIRAFRKHFFDYTDGKSAQRFVECLIQGRVRKASNVDMCWR